ncbi:MAG TPA: glycosyltransferase family 9 protein [Ktedonobacteraceae bacterium]
MKRFLRLLILLLVRLLGWPSIQRARRRALRGRTRPARILLLRPDHLGDLILTTPVLQAMRDEAPDAELTLMVGPWSREIVERHPALNQVLTCAFPGFQRAPQGALAPYKLLFKTARQLRRADFDLAINLRPDFWWGAALLYLAAIPQRVGYALAPGEPFLSQALPFPPVEHATVSNLRLASAGLLALNYQPLAEPFTPESYPVRFTPTVEELTWANIRLRAEGIAEDAQLIVISPGSGGAVKLWRSAAWAKCAHILCTTLTVSGQARILLTGSPAERSLVEEVARGIPEGATIVTDASIGQLAALLACATCLLTVDNGPGHIAAAQQTPGVYLFGPTDPRIFGPWDSSTRHTLLSSTQPCPGCPMIPCGRLDWSPEELDAHPCVRVISEELVLAATEKLLGLGQVYKN